MEFSINTRKQDSEEDLDHDIYSIRWMYRNVYVRENTLKNTKQKESAQVTSPEQTKKEETTEMSVL